MVTSEVVPFAKAGGLGDVVAALSKELHHQGHDVRIILPRYYSIDRSELEIIPGPLEIPMGFGQLWTEIYTANLPDTEVPVYFIEHEGMFGRDGIYGPSTSTEYPDNVKRFTMLSRGAFQLCKKLNWIPDVMHAHDWSSALIPVYLYTWEQHTQFKKTAGVFTIHNLGYQGIFKKAAIHYTQLTWKHFHLNGFEYYDKLNFLQAALRNADLITTVSPTYAEEIQTPEYGFQMDGILRHRRGDLFGVLNGIDYSQWDPEYDPHIPYHFSDSKPDNKQRVKETLQKQCGFAIRPDIPLVGMISRLVDQKGIGPLFGPTHGTMYDICKDMALQMVVLGTGERWCEEELRRLEQILPNLKVYLHYDNALAHMIEAGSDFFLMPSEYEPCGLNQMYSLRYGTLPIVRRTGGLADTVKNYKQETGEGTGFVFDTLSPQSIYDTVGWAVWTYYNTPKDIMKMRKRAMRLRFSWENSAERYAELYQWAIDRRTGAFLRTW